MQHFDDTSLDVLDSDITLWRAVVRTSRSAAAIGEPCEEIWTCRRGMGVLRLLLHGDHLGFFTELARSAQCRRYYLSRCAAEQYFDFYCTSSRSEPYFDALAASCFDLACALGRLSPPSFRDGEEYEDDFLYLRFLHRWVEATASNVELSAIMRQIERVLDGASSARLEVCKAFHARDGAAFERAFSSLLEERLVEVDGEKRGIADDSVCAAAGTYVFVEGIALLRLAGAMGFPTRLEYPLCPSLSRLPMTGTVPVDEFVFPAPGP